MSIIGNRKIWFTFSGILCGLSLLALLFWGLRLGIDFTGGSEMEWQFSKNISLNELQGVFQAKNLEVQVTSFGENRFSLKTEPLSEEEHQNLLKAAQEKFGEIQEYSFNSIGPTIGQELKRKTIWALVLVTLAVLFYIAWVFRYVSYPVPSLVYGFIVVLTFLHDTIIPLGFFAFLGKFYKVEIASPFIAAVLTILGYSINDTIVVLDRVRENLKRLKGNFEEIVEKSVRQSISRSINTSLTTLLTLIIIYLFGGETIKEFALALIIGIFFGTYSSIFIAAPMLVVWQKRRKR